MHQYLKKELERAVKSLSFKGRIDIHLEKPHLKRHGDLSTNIALILGKQMKMDPMKLAETISGKIDVSRGYLEKIEVIPPGFINFFYGFRFLSEKLLEILEKGENYGRCEKGKGIKTQVEFVSANPTGPLSVGHGRQAVLGDTIANILQWNGYDVTREYYFNNAGRQMRLLGLSVKIRYLQLLGEDIPFPEEGYQGEYIIDIAKKIFIKYGDTKIAESEEGFFKEFAEKEVFEDIKSTLSKLGVKFDVFYNEHSLYESGKLQEVVDDLRKKGLIYEKDGAIWFKTSRFGGDKDRVIIKSSGEPTYRLPDIAYHREKFRRGFQYIVDIFGADHHATYPDVLAGLRALGYNSENVKVLIHQFVTLTRNGKQVKMSTRKANFVTLDELLGEVGNDVVRYFFLMRNMNSHLNFDLSVAKKESEENPVYYLQYAHARICNILKYAREKSIKKEREIDFSLLSSREEVDLMKVLAGFPDTVFLILESLEPQHLTTYLQELATIFHKFYTEHRVVSRDRKLTAARLALVKGTKTVLANGLKLLGISTPEYM